MTAILKTVRGSWSSPWLRFFDWSVAFLEDGSFYWSLFRNGERVNGGLNSTEAGALEDAQTAAFQRARIIMPRLLLIAGKLAGYSIS